jgi:hypothetical protein
MGDNMAVFPKSKEFFEGLYAGSKVGDITPYYEKKAAFLWEIVTLYTMKYTDLEEGAKLLREEINIKLPPQNDDLPSHDPMEDEAVYLAIYEDMMRPDYEPPPDNLTGIQYHLLALYYFYEFVRQS